MAEARPRRRPRPASAALIALSTCAQLSYGQVCDQVALRTAASQLLLANYNTELTGTMPSSLDSPALFSTESAMAAYAYSHFDIPRGMVEMDSVLKTQWSNGLIPKIQYLKDEGTFLPGTIYPNAGVWRVPSALAGIEHYTAGIAAMPWFAHVAMQLFNQNRNADGLNFLTNVFKPIYNYHLYLHTSRDAGIGLVYTYHPWETDMPVDSPLWEEALQATQHRITELGWKCGYDLSGPLSLPGAPSLPVLTSEMFLVELLANASYSDTLIRQLSPFLHVDVQFNAVLAASDMSLAKMAQTLQLHSTSTVDDQTRSMCKAWSDMAQSRFTGLWDTYRYAGVLVPPSSSPLVEQNAALDNGASQIKKSSLARGVPSSTSGRKPAAPSIVTTSAPIGTSLATDVVSNFSPLYVSSGIAGSNTPGLLFQMLTPGIRGSFACPSDAYRLRTSACAVPDPRAAVSVLDNLVIQRGLAKNDDGGINVWLLNQTVSRLCNASMDPFSTAVAKGPFHFSRYFDPVDGTPMADFLGPAATLAAALAIVLLYPDAKTDAQDAPPISHDATFALVVIELIIAFATGVSCFVFSLNLFRKLQVSDSASPIAMLNVQEVEVEGGRVAESAGPGTTSHYYTFPDGVEPPAGPDTGAGVEEARRTEASLPPSGALIKLWPMLSFLFNFGIPNQAKRDVCVKPSSCFLVYFKARPLAFIMSKLS